MAYSLTGFVTFAFGVHLLLVFVCLCGRALRYLTCPTDRAVQITELKYEFKNQQTHSVAALSYAQAQMLGRF